MLQKEELTYAYVDVKNDYKNKKEKIHDLSKVHYSSICKPEGI